MIVTLAVTLIAITAISYRLWRIVGRETLTQPIRDRMKGMWLEWATCAWCSGLWCCAVVYFAWTYLPQALMMPIALIAGASTIVGLLGSRD